MNKKARIVIVLLLLLIAGLIYAKSRGGDQTAAPSASQSATQTKNGGAQLAAAIQSGQPTMCKMNKDTNYMDYYIEGNKSRMDSTTTTQVSHMINDGSYIYVWTDGQTQGAVKMKVPTQEETAAMQEQVQKYTGNTPSLTSESDYNSLENQGYVINCTNVSSDAKRFIPPPDITFIDIDAMMQAIPSPQGMTQEQIKAIQGQYGSMEQ